MTDRASATDSTRPTRDHTGMDVHTKDTHGGRPVEPVPDGGPFAS
jgi:hypothetical protein